MSEMVDRVARALEAASGSDQGMPIAPDYRALARAALASMREPTNKMIIESKYALKEHIEALPDALRRERITWRGYRVSWAEKMSARWRAMVDAALE